MVKPSQLILSLNLCYQNISHFVPYSWYSEWSGSGLFHFLIRKLVSHVNLCSKLKIRSSEIIIFPFACGFSSVIRFLQGTVLKTIKVLTSISSLFLFYRKLLKNWSGRNKELQVMVQCCHPLKNLWKKASSCLEIELMYSSEIGIIMLQTIRIPVIQIY